jgi:MFS family permease
LSDTAAPDARWRRDFKLLWAGQAVNRLGTEATVVALPLTAAVWLAAGPAEVGILEALTLLPVLVLSVPAGAWLDRRPRRPVMIACSLTAACVSFSVPLLDWMGVLNIGTLYGTALCLGSTGAIFDLGWGAHLPTIVPSNRLADMNGRLIATWSLARTVGRALGGAAVAAFAAPLVLLIDAVSYVTSAASLALIRTPEAQPRTRPHDSRSLTSQAREGLRSVRHEPLLSTLLSVYAVRSLAEGGIVALFSLYCLHDLHLTPAIIGGAVAARAAGGVIGATITPRLVKRFDFHGAATSVSTLSSARPLILPFLHSGQAAVTAILLAISLLSGLDIGGGSVILMTLGQQRSLPETRARVGSVIRLALLGGFAAGTLAAGMIAAAAGIRTTLLACTGVYIVSLSWLYLAAPRQPRSKHADVVQPQSE